MTFNISEFKNQGLKFGGARASLFDFHLTRPAIIGVADESAKLRFTCRAASIPASTVGQIEVPYFGRKIKLSGDRTFADWSITVMNDEDYSVRKMFEDWLFVLNSHEGNIRRAGLDTYKSPESVIKHYSKSGRIINSYTFVGLFPTEVSAMELDWDTTNAIQTFTVNLAYDYWIPDIRQTNTAEAPATLAGV